MKTIVVHSYKGGVGKTTTALLLAKQAFLDGRSPCVIDFDFLGSGMADLFSMARKPSSYLDSFFLSADPDQIDVEKLIGTYTDRDLGGRDLPVIFNLGERAAPDPAAQRETQVQSEMMGLMANELRYREIRTGTEILLRKLEARGQDLAIIDCHPGLDFISETLRGLASVNLYVTTTNRSDCFGLLKRLNLRKLADDRTFLLVNLAGPELCDAVSFRSLLEKDPLKGIEAGAIFGHHASLLDEERFGVIPAGDTLRRPFHLGGTGLVPALGSVEGLAATCGKVLARL